MTLRINDIYDTIQGEGVLTGTPMALVRFQGCDVACAFCDTKETWNLDDANEQEDITQALGTNPKWASMTPAQLALYIRTRFIARKWVLITGGEPADQVLDELVERLQAFGYKVAIETSGTNVGHLNAIFDWVCISPKNNPDQPVIAPAFERVNEIKQVVGTLADIIRLDALLQRLNNAGVDTKETAICLQPMSQSGSATELCVQTCMKRNWRLSLQSHKLAGLR